jgi:hypothetical protein
MLRAARDPDDLVSGANLPLFDDAEIEARPAMRNQQSRHRRVVHPYADAIAGYARLGHFEQCAADPVAISDTNLAVRQAIDRQVFAELAVLEVVPLEESLPIAVGVELIHHHGAVLSAVSGKIALSVAVEMEPARHHPAGYGLFPDSGADYPALPCNVTWKSDVHRDKRGHNAPAFRGELRLIAFLRRNGTMPTLPLTP